MSGTVFGRETHNNGGFENPGVAKAWCKIAANGDLLSPSYNVEAISDTGVGDRMVNFLKDFSSAVYAASVNKAGDDTYSIDVPSGTYAVGSLRVVAYVSGSKVDIIHTVTAHGYQ